MASPPKKKGNPVITRYPPPPGYRGPAQPQGPFGANTYHGQYPPPQPGFASGPQVPPSYPPQGYNTAPAPHGFQAQGYGAPQAPNYPQPAYPPLQGHQWPQPGYASSSGYSQPPGPPAAQGWAQPQTSYSGYPPQPAPTNPNQQAYGQTGGWPSYNGAPKVPSHHSHIPAQGPIAPTIDPQATPTPATVHMATSRAASVSNQSNSALSQNSPSEKPQIYLGWDDWDFDFDGAIWPKSNEPVDPALSLGVIIWHPAKQMTRALPSTFEEAENQALDVAPEGLDNGDSVSMYFTAENSHEAFLDVRQTDGWETIRDDPVFVVFTDEEMENNVVSIEDCIAQRDRPDEPSGVTRHDEDQEMHDASWDIMENLEQALNSRHGDSRSQPMKQEESTSPATTQEDILARLGVTGTPKPPSHDLPPASYQMHENQLPVSVSERPLAIPTKPLNPQPAPSRAHSYSGLPNAGQVPAHQRPYGSMSSGSMSRPPPPPPPPEQPRYDPWNAPQSNEHAFGGRSGSPALSEGSNRTMVGSDFESEKPSNNDEHDSSAVRSLQRSDSSYSRKRSYEDADKDEEQLRQQDDHSKRKRRSQVDAAYSRR
ncbi:hypothetical protein T440DRAFT_160419 [Plenodomus tracheiphilus IPT5]|uniref:Uncharacterized protein n=1 Tax=Plenodomus tracheiphilus IPT5 TaxID=1408161 RepID=A0A6A7BNH9_9PLEO|nr:hypothetical protein T440DRAFT_160419 [Plenodomus tracheiphilus IPT5]